MTHTTCPGCQLRFSRRAAATLPSCPFCGGPLAGVAACRTLGYQLIEYVAVLEDLPAARSDVLPLPQEPAPPRR
jgi:predicted RNA-binding Zn-ribbon protein involved in translation (DUF1610 family)